MGLKGSRLAVEQNVIRDPSHLICALLQPASKEHLCYHLVRRVKAVLA